MNRLSYLSTEINANFYSAFLNILKKHFFWSFLVENKFSC